MVCQNLRALDHRWLARDRGWLCQCGGLIMKCPTQAHASEHLGSQVSVLSGKAVEPSGDGRLARGSRSLGLGLEA